jgi:hypothetical protein
MVTSGPRPLSASTPRLISSSPYPCPVQVSRSRSRTAYPQLLLLQGQEEAGVRRWPTTTQNGSSTPTSTAKEELVRSDDAHQIKGPFFAPCSVVVSVAHNRSLYASSAPAIPLRPCSISRLAGSQPTVCSPCAFTDGVDIQLTEESRRGAAPVCCYAGGVDDGVSAAVASSMRY